ncbi:MAG: amidophosphoribosyltransferase [Actinobacteria bacterium]|nr:amidophosphoribosyltransferase [Actinomycetota bacterium]
MCGIVGVFYKGEGAVGPVGQLMTDMCDQLFRRGPDSAGVALYGPPVTDGLVVRVDLDRPDLDTAEGEVLTAVDQVTTVKEAARVSRSLRLIVTDDAEGKLADVIEERVRDARVFSVGRSMEIVKDLGMACDINQRYELGTFVGSHGIGHTRMATESRVDIAHSHPFWARPFPDISVVHNGQITNYHKLRRRLEQRGHRFATENDSEVIAVYIADKLEAGGSLDQALRASIEDLDGTFAYLISTANGVGLARDQFATKPLLYAEDDEKVVLASEEISIRALFPDPGLVPRELQAKEVRWWLR